MRSAVLALLLVALGGAAGSVGRAGIALALPGFPLAATLLVNVVGSFALGLVVTALDGAGRRDRQHRARLLLGTGLCGGFTTYSAVALQAAELAQDSAMLAAAGYAVVTLGSGTIAAAVGAVLVGRARAERHA